MAKDTFYFSHDYNARTDEKIKRLIRKHGMAGYGIFWAIVEDLYNNANALQADYEGIAFDLHTSPDTVESIVNDFDLFVFDGDVFGSLSVERRLNERNEKSISAQKAAHIRWEKAKLYADAMRLHSDSNAIKERKGKEKKEKEIVEDTQTPNEKSKFDIFNEWLKKTYPTVSKLKRQMTENELQTIIEKYGRGALNDILMQMENKADLNKKYTSVYLTANNWLQRGTKK